MTTLLLILLGCANPGEAGGADSDSGAPGVGSCLTSATYESDTSSDGSVEWQSVYTYNSDGQPLSAAEYYIDDGTPVVNDEYTWAYDDVGEMVLWTRSDGFSVEVAYDDHGNAVSYQYFLADELLATYTYSYTYDGDGNAITVVVYDDGVYDADYTYTYDVRANVLTMVHRYTTSDSGEVTETVTYTYDDHDSILTRDTQSVAEDGSVNTSFDTYTYTYDADGNVLVKVGDDWTDTYTYDADHNVLTHINVGNGSGKTDTNSYTFDAGEAGCSRTAIEAVMFT